MTELEQAQKRIQQLQNQLKKSDERFRLLFDGIEDAVIMFTIMPDGSRGPIVDVNIAACNRLGYSKAELLAMTVEDIDAPDVAPTRPSLQTRFASTPTNTFEVIHLTKSGERIPVEVSARRFDIDGTPMVLSIVRDITQRKALEELQQHHMDELEKLVADKTEELQSLNDTLHTELDKQTQYTKQIERNSHLRNVTFDILNTPRHTTTPESLFERIHGVISKETSGDHCYVALLDNTEQRLDFVYNSSTKELDCPTIDVNDPTQRKRLSLQPLIREETVVLTRKEMEIAIQKGSLHVCGELPQLWVGVPLFIKNKPAGVLAVQDYDSPDAYSDWDIQLIQVCARQLALALERKDNALLQQAGSDIIQNMPSGLFIYRYDPPDKLWLLDANPAAERITRINLSQCIGREFKEIWVNSEISGLPERFLAPLAYGNYAEFDEIEYDGDTISGAFRVVVFTLPDNRIGIAFDDITEQKQAEKAIKENEELHRALFQDSQLTMLLIDPENGKILDANKSACAFYGWPYERLTSMDVFELNSLSREKVESAMRYARENGIRTNEFSHKTADGAVRNVEIFSTPISVHGKKRLYSCVIDITEQKKAEKSLLESESRFRLLYLDAPIPYQSLDENGNFIEVNHAFCELLGYTQEEIKGLNFQDIIHPQWIEHFHANFPRLKAFGKITGVEYEIRKKNGEYILIALNGRIDYDSAGNMRKTYCVFRDITEERKVQHKLEESERRFRHLLDDMEMVAVQGYDSERRVIYWNTASELLYGYSREEALGNRLEELIIPDHMRDEVVGLVTAWAQGGPSIPPGELELRHKDGSAVPVYSSHVMQRNSSGQQEMYCVDVDLADIRKAHAELVQAKNDAEAANRAKSLFLANMSHELRTPLNGIMGMHQLLEKTNLSNEQSEYISIAVKSAKRLNALLGDILDLSKIEAGKISIDNAPFNVREVLTLTLQLFRAASEQKGIALNATLDENLPEYINGDQARLQQILNNIVGNAIKFTENGSINITSGILNSATARKQLYFSIQDTGIGIDKDKLDILFEAFTQVDEGYSRKYQGAGLGLSIVKRLITAMDGTLAVESEKESGTTVYFTLPYSPTLSTCPDPQIFQETRLPKALEGTILLAEDDTVNQVAIKRMLETNGCPVVIANNGKEALDILKRNEISLILMDIQMPVQDGIETTRAIRNGDVGDGKRNIPIIALTAYAMEGDRDTFINEGMDAYLAKPFELNELLALLTEVCA